MQKVFLGLLFVIFILSISYVLDQARVVIFSQNANIAVSSAGQSFERVIIGNNVLRVSVVDTPNERAKGLSGRWSMPQDHGMLFVFEKPDEYTFWMRKMHFAIDIIWIDEDKKIVDITYDATPESYPEVFAPKLPIQYVLEVNSGWASSHNVQIGSTVTQESR